MRGELELFHPQSSVSLSSPQITLCFPTHPPTTKVLWEIELMPRQESAWKEALARYIILTQTIEQTLLWVSAGRSWPNISQFNIRKVRRSNSVNQQAWKLRHVVRPVRISPFLPRDCYEALPSSQVNRASSVFLLFVSVRVFGDIWSV